MEYVPKANFRAVAVPLIKVRSDIRAGRRFGEPKDDEDNGLAKCEKQLQVWKTKYQQRYREARQEGLV